MWQLPPPRGTFLGDVPWEWLMQCKTKKVAHTIRGQELVWGETPDGIHGVTELVECERTQDIWLQSLQNEVRNGAFGKTMSQQAVARSREKDNENKKEIRASVKGHCQGLRDLLELQERSAAA